MREDNGMNQRKNDINQEKLKEMEALIHEKYTNIICGGCPVTQVLVTQPWEMAGILFM